MVTGIDCNFSFGIGSSLGTSEGARRLVSPGRPGKRTRTVTGKDLFPSKGPGWLSALAQAWSPGSAPSILPPLLLHTRCGPLGPWAGRGQGRGGRAGALGQQAACPCLHRTTRSGLKVTVGFQWDPSWTSDLWVESPPREGPGKARLRHAAEVALLPGPSCSGTPCV